MTATPKGKQRSRTRILVAAVVAGLVAVWILTPDESAFKQAVTWQRMTSPGALSAAHAQLEDDCGACHTSVAGVEPPSCIACHANNEVLLQRQPSAFHASISSCTECHLEHQGFDQRPTTMNHGALVEIGLRQLNSEAPDSAGRALREDLLAWTTGRPAHLPQITAREMTLDCMACHINDDRHFELFGQECAQCHATDRWTIPEYLHPSSNSMDCAQCHQAPPSHYMMHFEMISASVAGKPKARVDQCFECHQTTSWNDIKGVGWYKHH